MFAQAVDEMMALSPSELDDVLEASELELRRAELRLAAAAAVIESRQLFQDHGHRSMKGFLKQHLNCSGVRANRIRKRAAVVNQHNDVGDALHDGRVGAEQVDRLATARAHRRAGDRFDEFAPLLLDAAERLEYDDFTKVVTHFETQADPDGAFDDQKFQEDERVASCSITNGSLHLRASGGGPAEAEEMKNIFQRAVEAEFQKDCDARRDEHGDAALEHPLARTARQRAFDALHAIFVKSVVAPAGGKRPEPLVSFVIDPVTGVEALIRHGLIDLVAAGDGAADGDGPVDPATRRCATSNGTPVHPDVVVKAMLRGSVQRVFVDANGVIIDHGRRQRLFTGKAREAAQLLVTKCGHRGCDVPAEFCDVDHLDEWVADGGETNQANAMPACGVHDRWKHRHGLRGRRDRHGRIHLIRPDGTVIKPVGARDPEWAETDAPVGAPPDVPVATTPDARTSTPNDAPVTTPPDTTRWKTVTWDEMTATSPRLRSRPDPGWTMRLIDLTAA